MLSLHCFIIYSLNVYSQFCCKLRQFWGDKFIKLIKHKAKLHKIFNERNIYISLFDLRHIVHIPTFRIVNLLWFIGFKMKYRNSYLLNVSWPYLHKYIRTYLECLRRVFSRCLSGHLRTSAGHVPWSYIIDDMGKLS